VSKITLEGVGMRSDIQSEFDQQMDDLYSDYLLHCYEPGILPVNKAQFALGVHTEIMKRVDEEMEAV